MNRDEFDLLQERYRKPTLAQTLDFAIRDLSHAGHRSWLLVCEAAWELHRRRLWLAFTDAEGKPYRASIDYFRDAFMDSELKKSAVYQRLRVGKAIQGTPWHLRTWLRSTLAELGLSKAVTLTPAIRRTSADAKALMHWMTVAKGLDVRRLRREVSGNLGIKPRGRPADEVCPTCGRAMRRKRQTVGATN